MFYARSLTVDVKLRHPEVEEALALTPEAFLASSRSQFMPGYSKKHYINELCCNRCSSTNLCLELFRVKREFMKSH